MLSFKFRIKGFERHLRRHAVASNRVWNYCVEIQREAERRQKGDRRVSWPSAFDLIRLTTGVSNDLDLPSDTIGQICRQFVKSRDRNRRTPGFRASYGGRKSLGWMPFSAMTARINGDVVIYRKRKYRFWKSRDILGEYRAGSLVEDTRGRWYIVFQCLVANDLEGEDGSVGIDLGLKDLATLSDGRAIAALRHYRKHEKSLAVAQRARKKTRLRAIHAKIANTRRHHLHEQSTMLVRQHSLIVVGDVNAASLARTRMAKSVLDAGWSAFRHMLRYKAARRQAVYVEADERYSSQTCSCCGAIPASSPKGMGALGIRRWDCSDCGASHDRDVNAARNILRVGLKHQPPGGGIAFSKASMLKEAIMGRPLFEASIG
jgi:putative transposase